ncbi:predicted protein [Chaetomium globosum CBS 148.51]|uniref:Uncharacterized protein n=1 Tax=Chaetomium globosum (strain ATCC 6205 / CBS 148.51 / DSM 1962 / NBRC 6347 / NRRL 1970) TaxID=306901 RepID=Q2HEZ9_CHAGB|nr:uncharacterized protein CHGG_01205 [Chaetomium globosum CBS 148.51]EAQ92970.1 predicted protein [Chaetomium globosum CBS 148.51]
MSPRVAVLVFRGLRATGVPSTRSGGDRMAAVLGFTLRTTVPVLHHGCGYEARVKLRIWPGSTNSCVLHHVPRSDLVRCPCLSSRARSSGARQVFPESCPAARQRRHHAISNSSRSLSTNLRFLRGSHRPHFKTITEAQWCQRPDYFLEASFCGDAQSSEAVGFPLALKRFLYSPCDFVHATAILQLDGALPGLGSFAGSTVLLGP